jgi:hypothetical protein
MCTSQLFPFFVLCKMFSLYSSVLLIAIFLFTWWLSMQLNLLLREDKGKLEEAKPHTTYLLWVCPSQLLLSAFKYICHDISSRHQTPPFIYQQSKIKKKIPFLHRISWIWLQSPLPESYGAWCICANWKIFGYKVLYIFTYLGRK